MTVLDVSAEPWIPRFEAKIARADGGCWQWTGAVSTGGYGTFNLGRDAEGDYRYGYAHRLSYQLYVGPIPDGLTIDHLCRNKRCVNPDHLEPVTARENMLRGSSPGARAVRTGRCPKGHPYDSRSASGTQRCRTCDNEGQRMRYARSKGQP